MTAQHKNILVLSPIPTHPRNAGHRERIYQLTQAMQQFGHDVHFLYGTLETDGDIEAMKACWGERFHLFQHDINRTPNRGSPLFHANPAIKILRRVGYRFGKEFNFPYSIDDWYDSALNKFLQTLQQRFKFDIVVVEYLFFSKAFDMFDKDVLKILDTHDIFSDRHKLYQQQKQKPTWFYTNRRNEKTGLQRADVVIAIQEHEQCFFESLVPEKAVVTIGHVVRLCQLSQKVVNRHTILLLASANPVNVHGMELFLNTVFPLVRKRIPNTRFLVAGTICRAIEERPEYEKIGEVEDVKTAYDMADVVVSPVVFGTGMKIKNLEAMGHAKPLVTTPSGSEGLEDGAGTAFFCAANAEDFAWRITELLSNRELRYRLGMEAYRYAMSLHERYMDRLASLIQWSSPKTRNDDATK